MKIFNFAAGPSMIPKPVMERIQKEFRNYSSMGLGITEISHRNPVFHEILHAAEENIREVMNISGRYAVCFIQGGASLQYAMAPMNLMKEGGFAEYADTGYWAERAINEGGKIGRIKIIASSKNKDYDRIPEVRRWKPSPDSSYVHIITNNNAYGTQFNTIPELEGDVPLVADMSSDIMTRNVDVNQFGLIYASTQKVMGPTGVAVVIIDKSLAERSRNKNLPAMLDYRTYIEEGSLYNTPPTFSIYMLKLVTDWIKENGGMEAMDKVNKTKSEALYEIIDGSHFYTNSVIPSDRSTVNVVFKTPETELDKLFIKEARQAGLVGLYGHRSVKGLRASIYNAMSLEGVEILIDFMNDFEKRYA